MSRCSPLNDTRKTTVNFKGYKIHRLVFHFKVQSYAEMRKILFSKVERVLTKESTPKLHPNIALLCIGLHPSRKLKTC